MFQGPSLGLGKLLMAAGAVLVVAGLLVWLFEKLLPLGQLPGDFVVRGRHVTVFVPLATSLLLSLLLTLLVNLLWRR